MIFLKFRIFWFLLIFTTFSCTQKDKPIPKNKPTDFPSRTITDAEIQFNESGQEVIFAKGKLIEEYGFSDTVYTYFPKGIDLRFYENGKQNPGRLFADQAKVIPIKQWYEAKGNVKIITPDGDTIRSAEIYWDKRKKIIYSPSRTIISKIDNSEIIANGGVEATDDLKNYTLKNDSGLAYPE